MKVRKSTEPDLYVINEKPTKKELQELADFVEDYKRKQKNKKIKGCLIQSFINNQCIFSTIYSQHIRHHKSTSSHKN